MKNLGFILLPALLCLCFFASAQNAEVESKIAITDVYLHFGSFTERTSYSNIDDFRDLAPESELLMMDLSDFDNQGYGEIYNGNAVLLLSLGLKFKESDTFFSKANPLLRLGFSYNSGYLVSARGSKSESFPVDTLVSSQTGQTFIVDSVSSESYSMDYFTDQIRLDASLLFRTNPEARWSLYGGVGLAAGVSLNARTEVYYYNTQSEDDYHGRWRPGRGSYKTEQFRNKTNFALMAYIPLGVDFRLGNEKEFWKRTHLFYEISPGINFTAIPEIGTLSNAAFRNGLGLRVSWG